MNDELCDEVHQALLTLLEHQKSGYLSTRYRYKNKDDFIVIIVAEGNEALAFSDFYNLRKESTD